MKDNIVENQFLVVGSPQFFQKMSRGRASLPTSTGGSILGWVFVGIQFRQFVEVVGSETQGIIQF